MVPWSQLDATPLPDGTGELRLMQRGAEFSIMLGRIELMNSRISGSEIALADLSCRQIGGRPRPHLLIGGLGMGFTLRAALAALGPDAAITLAELFPAVVRWARGPMAGLFGDCLDDPRLTLVEADVIGLIRGAPSRYDAILLDVDNGPEGLTAKANDRLYDPEGLAAAWAALRPGGVLAVWSSGADPDFTRRLRRGGFAVEEVKVRANGPGRGARHLIWVATRPGAAPAGRPAGRPAR